MMKKIYATILFSLCIISCSKEEFSISNLNGNKIIALGHAGMGIESTYPVDSYESIMKCLSIGMDGSEFDVQMTSDSVLVLYHDIDLSEKTNLSGIIHTLPWSTVKEAHYTALPYLDYSIVSLEQLFSHIENLQRYKFTFDVKLHTLTDDFPRYCTTYINAIIRTIEKYGMENNVYIESQSEDFLRLFKSLKPDYKLFVYASFDKGMEMALSLGLTGITISTRDITKEQVETAHTHNLWITLWNVYSETDNIEAIKKNPEFIQTDEAENLMELLE